MGPSAVAGRLLATTSDGALAPQGPAAREIADLWWLMFWLGAAVFVLFLGLLVLAVVRGAGAPDADVPAGSRRGWLVGAGVVLPVVVLVVVLVATVETMAEIPDEAPPDALRIRIVGHQWWWEVHYPDEGVTTANEIHVPVGRTLEFTLTSADVIHSFWVPQLGGKLDLLPEDENTLVLRADQAGIFRSQCAEFCGLAHAKMRFVVVAEPPAEFAAWLEQQQRPAATAADQVFFDAGCARCHTVRGTAADGTGGPDLTHVASRRTLTAALLPNTAQQLSAFIADPHRFKEGTQMPPADLPADELTRLVEYVQGLR